MKTLIINQCIRSRVVIINNREEYYIMKDVKKYIDNLKRMFFYLFNMVPYLFVLVTVIAVLEAVLPYVNVIATQMIIDGLMEQKSASTIVYIIIITLAINVLFRFVLGGFRKKREIAEVKLELYFQKRLSIHELRLSLVDIESTKVQSLRRNIEQAKMRNGGIDRVINNFEIIVKNISSLIVAGIVFMGIFIGQHSTSKKSFATLSTFSRLLTATIISIIGFAAKPFTEVLPIW